MANYPPENEASLRHDGSPSSQTGEGRGIALVISGAIRSALVAFAATLMFASWPAYSIDATARQQQMAEYRKKIATAKILARAGKKKEAAAMMRSLFPSGPPGGEIALEYYRIIGSTPEGWGEAKTGLEKLVMAEPYVMLYRRELATHWTTREATRHAGIRALAALAGQPDADKHLTMKAWRDALSMLGGSAGDMRLYREYLAVDPANTEVRERLAKAQRGEDKRQRRTRELLARQQGLNLLDAGHSDEAERVLAKALEKSPKDPQIVGGLGLVRLRQGRHAEAQEFFKRALELDAGGRSKWKGLIATANFWRLMRESSAARDEKKLDIAEERVREALRLDPGNADGIALLGGIYADRGDLPEAEKLYRESIGRDPASGAALRGLVGMAGLMSKQGRRAEAMALLDSLGEKHGEFAGKYASVRAGILRDDADTLLAAGRTEEAIAALGNALSLAPGEPWVRFDLARLYQKKGSPEQGRALMAEGVNIAPDDPQMLHASALFLAGQDEADEALLRLEKIPPAARTESMLRLHRKMVIQSQIRQAAALYRTGNRADSLAILEHAGYDAGDDPEFVNSVANAWVERGDPSHAVDMMRDLLARKSPLPTALRVRYALLLNRVEQDGELSSLLEQLAAEELSGREREDLGYLQASLSIRRADARRKTGDYAGAREALAPALERDPENTDLLMALARVHVSAREPEQARLVYRRVIDHSPKNVDARLALAKVMRETGDGIAARQEIEMVLAVTPADDLDVRLDVADWLVDMKDMAIARQVTAQLTAATAGNNAHVLVLLGRIAKIDGRYDEAMGYFRQAREAEARMSSPMHAALALMLKMDDEIHSSPAAAPAGKQLEDMSREKKGISLKIAGRLGDVVTGTLAMAGQPAFPEQPLQTEAEEEIARMERRREGHVSAGYDIRSKPGTAGVSAFTTTELPIEARIPLGYSGHALVHIDPVSADAGTLSPNDLYTLDRYGQIQALAPAGIAGVPRQSARGVAVAVGYETDDWRADIGTTPLGFPVQDIVGGFKTYRSAEPFYYYADLSRRPVTSSLVSYAGARDPVSGEVWGGVRSNGGDFRVGFERGRFDAYVNLGYHLLTGKNVQTNTQFELRTGINREFLLEEDMRLSAGIVLTHWRYRDDLSYYTFGHGGYYSPQTYYSLATPVRWDGRTGRWSYLLKGSVSASASHVKDMPFYPARADLQALAGNPYYTGGSGHGMGYSLGGALEYQATPHLFIGGRIEIDRSEYYTPNFATIYLRYMFDPHTGPVPYPPAPVKPYSRF